MSDRQSHFPALSVHLSRVLDDVGMNTLTVNRRREASRFREKFRSFNNSKRGLNTTPFCFGSQVEGTTTPGLNSDMDELHCYHDIHVIQDWADWRRGVENQLLMIQEDTAPGYCRLQLLRPDVPMAMQRLPNKSYTYDRRHRIVLENTTLDLQEITDFKTVKNGPAQTNALNVDRVPALQCNSWCVQADYWTHKRRHCNWPTQGLMRKAVNSGFFLVPVGHKLSENKNLEWRMSFSLTERYLMFSMNIIQLKCYVLLKMIMKCLVIPFVGESISSYHCKTALFHCVEDTGAAFWTENNLLQGIIKCLSLLLKWVKDGHCPHYVLPESNLFDGKINPRNRRKLVPILIDMIENDGRFLLKLSVDCLGRRLMRKFIFPLLQCHILDSENTVVVAGIVEVQRMFYSEKIKINFLITMVELSPEEMIQQVHSKIIVVCEQRRQPGKYAQRAACVWIEFLAYLLASVQMSTSLLKRNAVSRATLKLLRFGAKHDIASRLKLASAYFCDSNFRKAERVLRAVEMVYEKYVIKPLCACYLKSEIMSVGFARQMHALEDIRLRSQYFGRCVVFAPQEIQCAPPALRHELAKMNKDDPQRKNEWDCWKLLAVVDALPYRFYLQYLTYSQLGKRELQERAHHNLQRCVREDNEMRHLETAWNLLGHCMEVEERWDEADSCYRTSLEIRPRHNAATLHIQNLAYRRKSVKTTPNV